MRAPFAVALVALAVVGVSAIAIRALSWGALGESSNAFPWMAEPPSRFYWIHQVGGIALPSAFLMSVGSHTVRESVRSERVAPSGLALAAAIAWLLFGIAAVFNPPPTNVWGVSWWYWLVVRWEWLSSPWQAIFALRCLALFFCLAEVSRMVVRGGRGATVAGKFVSLCVIASLLWSLVVTGSFVVEMSGDELLLGPSGLVAFAFALHLIAHRKIVTESRARSRMVPMIYVLQGAAPQWALYAFTSLAVDGGKPQIPLRTTYLDVACTHAGASILVLTFLGAIHLWSRELLGCRYEERQARIAAAIVSLGMLATTVSMILLGREGMPKRYYSHLATLEPMHRVLTVSALVTVVGVVIAVASLRAAPADRTLPSRFVV